MPRARKNNVTLVAVGDKTSRKTELLLRYTSDRRMGVDFAPPIFTNNVQKIIVDYVPYSVYFVDAESEDDYQILRQQTYVKANCILLCYSIRNRESLLNISQKWCIEVRKSAPNTPIILVATDAEARSSESANLVSVEVGENLKLLIGAYAIIECSIAEFSGVDDVFIAAIRSLNLNQFY